MPPHLLQTKSDSHRTLFFSKMPGAWKELSFKTVNLRSMGVPVAGGSYHPLLKVRAEFRRILMEMGFEEVPPHLDRFTSPNDLMSISLDAHEQVGGELLLELRRALPAAEPPGEGRA